MHAAPFEPPPSHADADSNWRISLHPSFPPRRHHSVLQLVRKCTPLLVSLQHHHECTPHPSSVPSHAGTESNWRMTTRYFNGEHHRLTATAQCSRVPTWLRISVCPRTSSSNRHYLTTLKHHYCVQSKNHSRAQSSHRQLERALSQHNDHASLNGWHLTMRAIKTHSHVPNHPNRRSCAFTTATL